MTRRRVRLSVAVMAHRSRTKMVDDLLDRLDRPATVVWDQINDRHDTGARSMEAFDPKCTHHLVIQDDALPCRDLLAGAERAIAATSSTEPVSLYVGRVRPFAGAIGAAVSQAKNVGASWVRMQGIYWGPGIIVPTATIPEMLRWFRGAGSVVTNYDRRLSVWYAQQGLACWYTRPSLVEHRGGPSIAGHPGSQRRAFEFLGQDASALDVDWSGPVIDLPHSDRMDDARQAAAALARRP